ncbi:unnamed protein product [Closterium sp. NIES-53]
MLALCREHRLEHRTKHIALRYFLARQLQQRGQLRLAYVASEANTADIFTKALPPGDHQRFCTLLGFPTCTQHSLSSFIPGSSQPALGAADALAPREAASQAPRAAAPPPGSGGRHRAAEPPHHPAAAAERSSCPAAAAESDSLRAASPSVTRLLSTVVTDPSFESAAASALVAELVDFAACCRLDYAAGLVAESASVCPPSVGGECALSTDVLEDRQEEFQCFAAALPHLVSMLIAPEGDPDALDIPTPRSYGEAIEGPYSSQWQSAMDAEMASWKSTGTYEDFDCLAAAVPHLVAMLLAHEGDPDAPDIQTPRSYAEAITGPYSSHWQTALDGEMASWKVKRPPGSPPVVKAHYVARGFRQRQRVDFFKTFSPSPKMTTLRGSMHEEIWLHRPLGFTGSFPAGTQTTLAALGFAPSTTDLSLFLRTDTSLPPFYVLVYVNDLIFATGYTEALALVKSELQNRHTCTDLGELRSYLGLQITRHRARCTITLTQSHMVHQVLQRFGFRYSSPQSTPLPTGQSLSAPPSDDISGIGLVLGGRGPVVLTGHADTSWVDDLATQRSSQSYTFSLGSGSIS